jgi:hypothetical protein
LSTKKLNGAGSRRKGFQPDSYVYPEGMASFLFPAGVTMYHRQTGPEIGDPVMIKKNLGW